MNLHILHATKSRTAGTPGFMAQPSQFNPGQTIYLKEYGRVEFRPIRPDDEAGMIHFHETLSEESVYLRYFEHISLDTRTLHERLAKVCINTPDSYATVAERHETKHHPDEIIAVGRLTTTDLPRVAAFATLMSEKNQVTELPHKLLNWLITIARAHGFHTLTGELLMADYDTLTLCRNFGFTLQTIPEDGIVLVSHPL